MKPSFSNSNHRFVVTKKLEDIQAEVGRLSSLYDSQDILVLFDIDTTLCQVVHPEYHPLMLKKYLNLRIQAGSSLKPPHLDLMANIAIMSAEWVLVDEEFPTFIKSLQTNGIKTIALTASLTGKLEEIENIEQNRYQRLKIFDIDFSHSFGKSNHIFTQIPAYLGNNPVYYNGILCSNGEKGAAHNKGHALNAFLEKFEYQPKAIILIDDKIKNITDISNTLNSFYPETQYIGIEYLKAHDLPFEEVSAEKFKSFWESIAERSKSFMTTL